MPRPDSASAGAPRRGRTFTVVTVCVVLLAAAGYTVNKLVKDLFSTDGSQPARCTVQTAEDGSADEMGDGTGLELYPAQSANAATIAAVAAQRELPERAATIALATAMQESSLRNIDYGDRDSIGLFQQRPSQGWGSQKQILDPVYASEQFYEGLVEIPGYTRLPLTEAAQRVQRSAFPDAYAKHEEDAALLTSALTGRSPAALNCTTGPGGSASKPGSASRVKTKLNREFGARVSPRDSGARSNSSGDGGSSGSEAGGKRAEALTVPADSARQGWEVAHWAVSHAAKLRIDEISFQGRVWSAEKSEDGWKQAEDDDGAGKSRSDGKNPGAVVLRLATGE